MIEGVLVFSALTNLALVGSSRLHACIRTAALQGIALGLLPLFAHSGPLTVRLLFLAVGSLALKGFAFPWLLSRAVREANVRREMEPYVGYTMSVLVGLVTLGVSLGLGAHVNLAGRPVSRLVFPVALFTILTGLFLIVSRRKALTQALGYLVMENGIYAFGVVLVGEVPLLVELGVLLDVFVAVLVMGIAIYHIGREFERLDVDELDKLRG